MITSVSSRAILLSRSFWLILLISVLVKTLVLLWTEFFSSRNDFINHVVADIWSWLDFFDKTRRGAIPYVDITKEYPVGAGVIYWLMGFAVPHPKSPSQTLAAHVIVMSLVDVALVCLTYWVLEKLYPRAKGNKVNFFLAMLLLLTPTSLVLGPVRFEGIVLLTSIWGYFLHKTNRPQWAILVWSLGCTIKWFPIVFIAVQEIGLIFAIGKEEGKLRYHSQFLAGLRRLKWLRSVCILALVFLVVNLPFIVLGYWVNGNISKWTYTYLFHVYRPLFWDTVLGVMQLWWGRIELERWASVWSAILMIAVLFVKPRLGFESKSVLVVIAALLLNRVYSTQFNLWFIPFLLFYMAQLKSREEFNRLVTLYILLDIVNIAVYPLTFTMALNELEVFRPFAAQQRGGFWTIVFSVCIVFRFALLILLSMRLYKSDRFDP